MAEIVLAGRPVTVVVSEWGGSTTHRATKVRLIDGWLVVNLADGNLLAWPDHIVRGQVKVLLPALNEDETGEGE